MMQSLERSVPPGPQARQPLYLPTPEQIEASQLSAFIRYCEQGTGQRFDGYHAFEQFAIERSPEFWQLFLDWSGIRVDGSPLPVRVGETCESATFFPDVRLNYADTLLQIDGDRFASTRPALTAVHADRPTERFTRGELRERAMAMSSLLLELGLGAGDRVSILAHNTPGAIIAALGAAGIGSTISTGAPDLGAFALTTRFSQTEPKLLIAELPDAATALGMQQRQRFLEVVAGLPSLRAVLLLDDGELPPLQIPVHRASELLPRHRGASVDWPQLPFNHPLFILFTSGTTGIPKCLVHGAGGTLIEHLKEHRLHCDLRPDDKLFFQTSTGWMMWNWQLSALASGCEIVVNDAPMTGADSLWGIVARERVTAFGTSPAYLQMCERSGWAPHTLDFSALRSMYSTGSILYPRQQEWVWQNVKPIAIQSISGGTDIVGCFVLGNPNLPVYSAEPQCRSLGLDVRAIDVDASGIGELICANPFPSRPVSLLDDPDRSRFHKAYFGANEGVWTHGDLIEFTKEGSARMHGRSDGVLNIRGIRIGPAEIYRILEDVAEIVEAMAVEQPVEDEPGGARLVLLVVLKQGIELSAELVARIKRDLSSRGSPAHVPSVVLAVDQLPTTFSGKRSERSARDALSGKPIINAGALRNPECLEPLKAYAAGQSLAAEALAPAPTLPLRDAIAQIWQEALGMPRIGPDENYFDLGGDSYQAIQILAALRERLGRDIPMKLLLEAPTIALLAAALERPPVDESDPLVLLAEGRHSPPLFIVHGIGGSVMELRALAQALEIGRPVYGVQARGLAPHEQPHASVEDMAREYLDAIRSVQPAGPYLLLGYSFGGWVAYEIARLLRAQGERVALLGILDTTPREQRWPAAAWREYFWRRLAIGLRQARDLGLKHWPEFWLSLWRSFVERARRALKPQVIVDGLNGNALPEQFLRVREAGIAAAIAYQPAASDLEVCLFRSDLRQSHLCDPRIVWDRLVSRVELHDVPGNHLTMVRPPNLEALARQLSQCVRNHAPLVDREGKLFEALELESQNLDAPLPLEGQTLAPQVV